MLLVQMAGRPGVGKSTVARAVARRIGGVVFDNDVVKSALLDSGVPWDLAGPASWNAVFALAAEALSDGRHVILDNPSHYRTVPKRGLAIAEARGAEYAMLECVCPDDAEVGRRLAARPRLRSHMAGFGGWAPDSAREPATARSGVQEFVVFGPATNRFEVRTDQPVDGAVEAALAHLRPLLTRSTP